jgi:hypothetical protein
MYHIFPSRGGSYMDRAVNPTPPTLEAGMTPAVRSGAMKILLSAAVAALVLAACAPEDYPREAAGAEASHEVTGGADPTAVSGRSPADSEDTIHHPEADGNSGRPPARPATTTEAGGSGKR